MILMPWIIIAILFQEKTLESPLDCKIKSVNPNQPWIFIWRTDAEAEAPILWPPDAKSLFTGKDPDAGKDWRKEEKGAPEDEMVGLHHQLNGHEFEQTPVNSEGQGNMVCCSPWGLQVLDTTEQPNKNMSDFCLAFHSYLLNFGFSEFVLIPMH